MTTKSITNAWEGVAASVYYMDKGDKIPRHQHDVEHTTAVICGRAIVEIISHPDRVFEMSPAVDAYILYVLPANIDHEITALEDNTIVINMIKGNYRTVNHGEVTEAASGGVELDEN